MKRTLALVCVLAISQGVAAMPLCVAVQGIPDQCLYVDGAQCEREATRLGGICKSNPTETIRHTGSDAFCLVVGGQAAVCAYSDRTSCQQDATRHGSACIAAAPTLETDPFAIRRPY